MASEKIGGAAVSDTPRTDAAARLVRTTENGVLVHANFARELERENAALNKTTRNHVAAYYELLAQNAALRELASRMATEMREVDHEFASLRDYDAARKEAQPIRADHVGDINEMIQVGKEAQP